MSFQRFSNYISTMRSKKYGRSIPVIATELVSSTVREKRFYIALIYFVAFPLLLLLIGNVTPAIQTGPGIAIFQAQTALRGYILVIYTSFFLGQIFLVILNADAISGEIEEKTFSLLRSKPVYDSEIVFGKFLGMFVIISILDIPILIIIYMTNLVKFEANFPLTYLESMDELFATILLVLLLQSVIVALTLVFSAIFSRSLYSILSSLLGLFIISQIAGILGDGNNYISLEWITNAALPKILYHLEPIKGSTPAIATIFASLLITIFSLLSLTVLILRHKELS